MAVWPATGRQPKDNVDGARPHRHHRRAPAQPQERHRRDPEEEARRPDRRLRLGQVLARLRHALRRGPAPLHREPLRLRPAVPRADGEAALRLDQGPRPHHLDRAEDGQLEPALHGRHGHRDPRLPARAVGAGRAAHLPPLRAAGLAAVGAADRPRGPAAPGGDEVPRPRPAREGAQGRAPRRHRAGRASPGSPASAWTASCSPSRTRSASTRRRSTRSTRSWTAWSRSRGSPSASPTRWRRRSSSARAR